MSTLPRGSAGVAVDLPDAAWGKSRSQISLEAAIKDLNAKGYKARAIFGDSACAAVKQLVMLQGPYDAALIDGDHRYPAVLADWQAYGTMARIVAFHDIDGDGQSTKRGTMLVEVPRLWNELKPAYAHREIIGRRRGMGIGVLWR